MSTDTSSSAEETTQSETVELPRAEFEALQQEFEELRERVETLSEVTVETDDQRKRMTIIATKGTLDMAYPPLILASTAAAFGWDVVVFFTFWGLDILHEERSKKLKVSAVGNPSMHVPNAVAALPGMDSMTTKMMQKRIAKQGTATIEELIRTSLDMGVKLQACQMTTELFGYDESEFYEGVTTGVGAATALAHMGDADVQLMI